MRKTNLAFFAYCCYYFRKIKWLFLLIGIDRDVISIIKNSVLFFHLLDLCRFQLPKKRNKKMI